MHNPHSAALLCLVLFTGAGCAHDAAVSAGEELPLKKVVVYRNGVAYFERAGTVESERVEFKVRPEHVGDFLATLSVVEAGGSSVRSASFPIRDGERPEEGDSSKLLGTELKTVVLELDGEKHDLRVGYVSEQPVWRPSYRLIFDEATRRPMLQAWGIVQNVSGEDWKNVRLSLVAGAPIAFESTLATPVTPQRPMVLDSGEVIAAVPRGENILAQRTPPPPPSAAPEQPGEASADGAYGHHEQLERERPSRRSSRPRPSAKSDLAPPPASAPASAPPAPPASSAPRNLALLANAQVQAGSTRYDLAEPVTIPNESATMVLLVSREVSGEAVFMFAPDGGVPESSRHPFRVVRFTNDTPGLLERGPIAVIESGAFLGQGVLEPLAAGGDAMVPFALERALAVDTSAKNDVQGSRLARIEAGQLTVERDQVLRTTYRVRNGQKDEARMLLRHPRVPEMRLYEAPKGTDDRVGQGNALVPARIRSNDTAEVVVEERRSFKQVVDWMSEWADTAVKGYLVDPRADAVFAAALQETWALRDELLKTREQRTKLDSERHIVREAAEETRANLTSLKKNAGARVNELRQQLATRLSDLDKRHAELFASVTELALKENELRIRFEERVRELKLERGLPAPKV